MAGGRGSSGATGGVMPPSPVGGRPIPGRSPFDVVNDGANGAAPTFGGGLPYSGGQPGPSPVLGDTVGGMAPLPPSPAPPAPAPSVGGLGGQWVDAGYGQGALNAQGMQQAIPTPNTRPPAPGGPPGPAQQPGPQGRPPFGPPGPAQPPGPNVLPPMPPQTMPAGMPPQNIGGAPVSAKPASVGMSSAADAQAQMMKRAGVQQVKPYQGKKPAPMPAVEPKPMA